MPRTLVIFLLIIVLSTAGFMFTCFDKEKVAVIYDALTADTPRENHINCTQINNQTFFVCQNFM